MILVGGVGYTFLGDMSFGAVMVERLRAEPWQSDVMVEDVSYNPITVMDWLRDEPGRFTRAVLIGAAERGRQPGTLSRVAWASTPQNAEQVQDRVAEAVTGTISLENLLVIGTHFGLLPPETTVIELEPVESGWGQGLSEIAERRAEEVTAWLRDELSAPATAVGNGAAAS
ncbi:MAG: hydrogenase maturation protease [Chloroflexota bacterium]